MANPHPFVQVQGYQDPYEELRKQHAARVAAAEQAELNPQPLYSPEEASRRQQAFQQMQAQGQVGMLANDPSITGVAKPLLARAMEAQKPQYREHGIFNEPSGSFKYFPGYQEARKTEAARRQQELTENQSARARASYDLMIGRMHELEAIKRMTQGNEDKGSVSHAGADAQGNPIFMHSKAGPFQYVQGRPVPYHGPITPKLSEMPGGIQSKLMDNRAGSEQVATALEMLKDNPQAVGVIGWLPEIARQYVPGKAGSGGVGVRAAVADLGSLRIHARSGAAVTAKEFPRLKPFIPDISRDSPHTIAVKLMGFKRAYDQIIGEIEAGYPLSRIIAQGNVAPGGRGAPPPAPGQAVAGKIRTRVPGQPSDDDLINKYLPKGGPGGQP